MRIFIARHGQSEFNRMHKVCGLLDPDLSDLGRKQADELAERLHKEQQANQIKAILVSPLKRARQTAEPIEQKLGIKAVVVPELHERDFGIFDGVDISDPELSVMRDEPFVRLPGGESPADVARRVYDLLDKIRADYSYNVLLVCHGALSRIINTYFHSMTIDEYKGFMPPNCSLLEYDAEPFSNSV